MIKKAIAFTALSALSLGLLVGCGKQEEVTETKKEVTTQPVQETETVETVEISKDNPSVFISSDEILDENSTVYNSYIFQEREAMFNKALWFALTDESTDFEKTKQWDEVKNLTFGEATLLAATGIDELEGIEFITARLETTKQNRVWGDAFDEHMASYSLAFYNNSPGAVFLFGEDIKETPCIAIQKVLGDPTVATFGENNTLTAEYRFENYFCTLTLEKVQEGVHKISLIVSSQPVL